MTRAISGLSGDQAAVMLAVRDGTPHRRGHGLAWSRICDLERAGHDGGVVRGLVGDWLALWKLKRCDAVTLTPLAAYRLGVELDEPGVEHDLGENESPPLEWVESGRWAHPVRLAHTRGRVPLELVGDVAVDPAPAVEYLLDPYTGEPRIIFGQKVPIDRRMG